MKRQELYGNLEAAVMAALDGRQAEVWTSLPGIIESYDASAQTASVQPAVKGWMKDEYGRMTFVELPLLVDVPVEFPAGGGFTLTFPVKPGDECVVEFQARCIDGWWQAGGIQKPLEKRMHDLSDGICRVGLRSQARMLAPAPDTESVQLRSDDGQAHLTIKPDYSMRLENPGGLIHFTPEGEIVISALSKVSIDAPLVEIAGERIDLLGETAVNILTGILSLVFNSMIGGTASGSPGTVDMSNLEILLKEVIANGIKFTAHTHPGVSTGSGKTGAPQ